MDAETFVQAYVNIVAGACISLGKLFLLIHAMCMILNFFFFHVYVFFVIEITEKNF